MAPNLLTCTDSQVEAYLEAFAKDFRLHQHVRYNTRVVEVLPCGTLGAVQNGSANGHVNGGDPEPGSLPWPRWQVITQPSNEQVCPALPKGVPLPLEQSLSAAG